MRRSVFAALCACALAPAPALAATGWWAKLWRNADQRGEQLLDRGDAGAAARTYADPRRRAYAKLRAGDYDAAAKGFAAFDDADAHYDRGNALARAGRLRDAIAAYDAALARDPGNADARHNRALVERELRQRSKSARSPKHGTRSDQQRAHGGRSGSPDGRGRTGKSQGTRAGGAGRPRDEARSGQRDAARKHARTGSASAARDDAAKRPSTRGPAKRSKDTGAARAARAQAAAGAHERAGPSASASPRADAAHGRHAAGAPAGAASAGQRPDGAPQARPRIGQQAKPRTEQQLAEDQWLRRIPDDPGGLLRRKFLIEHLMRQQGKTP